jgi:hypothetical protein
VFGRIVHAERTLIFCVAVGGVGDSRLLKKMNVAFLLMFADKNILQRMMFRQFGKQFGKYITYVTYLVHVTFVELTTTTNLLNWFSV